MFEFHGWATIRLHHPDVSFKPIGRGPAFEVIKRLRQAVNEAHDEFCDFEIRRSGNGLDYLSVHGLRNHRYEPVIDLFHRVASELPDSYGLLYIFDDEDSGRGSEFGNESRVWRLARGRFEELDDPFLSPYFPTVEEAAGGIPVQRGDPADPADL